MITNFSLRQRSEHRLLELLWDELDEMIRNGNRTDWSPIRSVIIRVITTLIITRMITDRIGRHEVLLPIDHKKYNFQEENRPSYEGKGKFALKD